MSEIVEKAKKILNEYPIRKELPASISGKYHIGETQEQHVAIAVNVIKHLCDEFNIHGDDRELLIAATYLHDLGLYIITTKKQIKHWRKNEKTGWSRAKALHNLHPIIGASLLDNYNIPRKDELKRLISIHMSHWYSNCPQPCNLYEYLICIADYVASRGINILEEPKR